MEIMERRAAALGEELAVADGAAGAAVARRRAEVAGDRSALFWLGCSQFPCSNATVKIQSKVRPHNTSAETLPAG